MKIAKATFSLLFILFCSFISLGQGFTIDAFEIDMVINEQGQAIITEKIGVDFSKQKRGIYRTLPYKFKINGHSYSTKISAVSVENKKSEVSRKNGNLTIKIGDRDIFLDGAQEYIIHYTVDDAFVAYEDHQEFYWNLTGNEWPTPIEHVDFSVTLPKEVTLGKDDLKIYTGKNREVLSSARIKQVDSKLIEGANIEPLGKREGMTVALRFPTGYLDNINMVTANEIIEKNKSADSPLTSLIPAGLMALLLGYWRRLRGKNEGNDEIALQHYPPKGLTSAHVGAFIDHTVNDRDLISLIPFWASEGYVKLIQTEDSFIIERLGNLPNDFPIYELSFFKALFKEGDQAIVSSFKDKFYTTFAKIKSEVKDEIDAENYYDDEYKQVFRGWKWFLLLAAVLVFGILAIALKKMLFLGFGLIALFVFALVLSAFRSPVSKKGSRVHRQLQGLKAFLADPDPNEINRLLNENPKYFEQLLPYAVAFGIDDSWTKTFSSHFQEAPYWYYGTGVGTGQRPSFSTFSEQFTPKEISSAFTSYPSTDHGGGSSGGGFSGGSSGGGFGGGGGGSW